MIAEGPARVGIESLVEFVSLCIRTGSSSALPRGLSSVTGRNHLLGSRLSQQYISAMLTFCETRWIRLPTFGILPVNIKTYFSRQ